MPVVLIKPVELIAPPFNTAPLILPVVLINPVELIAPPLITAPLILPEVLKKPVKLTAPKLPTAADMFAVVLIYPTADMAVPVAVKAKLPAFKPSYISVPSNVIVEVGSLTLLLNNFQTPSVASRTTPVC